MFKYKKQKQPFSAQGLDTADRGNSHKVTHHNSMFVPRLDELETLLLIMRNTRLEEHWVGTKLRVQQRHIAVDGGKVVQASMPSLVVPIVLGQTRWTLWTSANLKIKSNSKVAIKHYLNVHLDVTLMGGRRETCETRKFMAISSQFMYSSTLFRMAAGIQWVYRYE